MSEPQVLIIGAGMSGLTAARELLDAGVRPTVLDKGQKPGGRMATRTLGEARFDHGAQHFGMRDPAFRRIANDWMEAGIVREWFHAESGDPDAAPNVRHGAIGGMRNVAEHLARGIDVHTSVKATRLDVAGGRVEAHGNDGLLAEGTAVIVTAPVPQTLELLDASSLPPPDDLRDQLEQVAYDPCLAVMARLDGTAALRGGHATPESGPIAWIGDNEHKGVSPVPAVTIHSTPEFARRHMSAAVDEWVKALCDAAAAELGSPIVEAAGHRWRYSEPQTTLDSGAAAFDGGVPVVLGGEVFAGARIEGAYLSGREAARQLLDLM